MAGGTPSPEDILSGKPVKPIAPAEEKMAPQTEQPFSSFMQGSGGENPLIASGKTPQVSPFDLAHGKVPAPGPTLNTIQQQALSAHSSLGDIANQLNTPNLKLKQSTKYLLKNKLSGARGQIQSASSKMGAPMIGEQKEEGGSNPLKKYLQMVSGGQRQLDAAQEHLKSMSESGEDLKPAEMLLIQVKLNKAQQQLEYSSMLLSKAIDDLKMLFNIQL